MSVELISRKKANEILEPVKVRSILTLEDLSADEIRAIASNTIRNKETNYKKIRKTLKDQRVITVFDKPSLRTYAGTVAAIQELRGQHLQLSLDFKRETIEDQARTLGSYGDAIVARLSKLEDLRLLNEHFIDHYGHKLPVISGMTDFDHPLQALADVVTAAELIPNKKFAEMNIAYLGPWNNIARSVFQTYTKLGSKVSMFCPDLTINEEVEESDYLNDKQIINYKFANDTVGGADIIYTDVRVSMGENKTAKELKKYLPCQVNEELLSHASKFVIVQHCMPMHIGEEITQGVHDQHKDYIYQQAGNRMHATASLLAAVLRNN